MEAGTKLQAQALCVCFRVIITSFGNSVSKKSQGAVVQSSGFSRARLEGV